MTEGRILVTEDKDFGELVFVQRSPHGTITVTHSRIRIRR
jgi:predicted nuclease of predicted toxin-antitoxin system